MYESFGMTEKTKGIQKWSRCFRYVGGKGGTVQKRKCEEGSEKSTEGLKG